MNDILTVHEAAKVIGVKPRTLDKWRHQRKGPSWSKIGRLVRYSRLDVAQWVASCRVESVR